MARLAQMDVHIDQAGSNGQSGCVENLRTFGCFELARPGDLGDTPILEQNVLECIDAGGGINQMAATNY